MVYQKEYMIAKMIGGSKMDNENITARPISVKGNFEKLNIEIYGESHAPEIGVRMGGIPDSCTLTLDCMRGLLARRKSGSGVWATPRKEEDEPIIVSGLEKTDCGYKVNGTIEVCIKNNNVRPKDYDGVMTVPRPSHADYAAYVKDGKISSGGGRFSGRMTAPLCVAGGIAKELLSQGGISVCAYISSIGEVDGASYKSNARVAKSGIDDADIKRIEKSEFPLLDESSKGDMINRIMLASQDGDSVGGTVECIVTGLEAGLMGDALYEGLEGKIAYSVYAIPAVKGVEFGSGFDIARMSGSRANDAYQIENGSIVTGTNNSGGINGGITNGMPVTLRVAFRPTPSISQAQRSVDLSQGRECELKIKGRHDSCIVPRAVPCVESAVALALLDEVLKLRDGIELYGDRK